MNKKLKKLKSTSFCETIVSNYRSFINFLFALFFSSLYDNCVVVTKRKRGSHTSTGQQSNGTNEKYKYLDVQWHIFHAYLVREQTTPITIGGGGGGWGSTGIINWKMREVTVKTKKFRVVAKALNFKREQHSSAQASRSNVPYWPDMAWIYTSHKAKTVTPL